MFKIQDRREERIDKLKDKSKGFQRAKARKIKQKKNEEEWEADNEEE